MDGIRVPADVDVEEDGTEVVLGSIPREVLGSILREVLGSILREVLIIMLLPINAHAIVMKNGETN